MPGISSDIDISLSLEKCISDHNATSSFGDNMLKDKQLSRVVEILSQLVDQVFEDAATKLNLQSLTSFLFELCNCSRKQLFPNGDMQKSDFSIKTSLLFRLSEVILRCAKSK